MADINPYAGGSIPSNIYTKKEEGYATKGNAEKTRKKDDRNIFQKAGDKAKSMTNNAKAKVLGDRAIDYSQYSDKKLEEMKNKNPGSADSIAAQREINKRNEAAGMATKAVNVTNAQGGKDDMRFSSGNTLEDAKTFGDTKAKDVPQQLREMGKDPSTTSREEAAALTRTDNPTTPTTPTAPTAPSATGSAPAVPSGPTGKTADWTNKPTEEVSPNVNLGEGQTAAELDEQVSNEPRKTLDDIMGDYEKKYQESITATPEMKSIWEAWKNGDIDKSTRNYFIADAIAKFAGDMGNISNAQHANNMWANIEKGEQKNPMENVKGESQWQDYLKTDWKEAQKQKWEGKKKRMESMADILKEADLADYVANSKVDIMANSKAQKMAEENPTKFIHMLNTQRTLEGDPTMSNMDKNALVDAKADIEQAQRMGVIDENTARSQQKILDLNIQYYDQEMAIKKKVAEGQLSIAQAELELQRNAAWKNNLIAEFIGAGKNWFNKTNPFGN